MRPSLYPIILSGEDLSTGAYRLYSPANNAVIYGGSAVFNWTAGSETGTVEQWRLYADSTVGGRDYHDSGLLSTATLSRSVSGLPTSGTIHVTLWAQIAGAWQKKYYTYTGSA
jgi:hypothetical protein